MTSWIPRSQSPGILLLQLNDDEAQAAISSALLDASTFFRVCVCWGRGVGVAVDGCGYVHAPVFEFLCICVLERTYST